ncbi:MAG: transglycosylase SLT domain-containing protein [Bacteroidetes bacterium]|nr:transglycosylase SLT domain-containing protein [Bacteroidota bacterium]
MKYILAALFVLTTGVLAFLSLGNHPVDAANNTVETESPVLSGGVQPAYPAVKMPKDLTLAGEPVPMDDQEVLERMDRELLVNSYWHSQTLQNLKLANRWFPVMEPILAKNGIPDDFKYLAVAESNLRNVVSPAEATGFWQLLESTAKENGLVVSAEVDQRYDVERSTEAACRYLKRAHDRYGSWTLAAASYNMGMGGVDRKLSDQQVKNYYDLFLSTETSRYVFRILAFKLIYEQHERYGFVLEEEDLYPPLEYREITVNASVADLQAFAIEQGSNYKMLRYLNPWIRSSKLTVIPGKPYTIKLPKNA